MDYKNQDQNFTAIIHSARVNTEFGGTPEHPVSRALLEHRGVSLLKMVLIDQREFGANQAIITCNKLQVAEYLEQITRMEKELGIPIVLAPQEVLEDPPSETEEMFRIQNQLMDRNFELTGTEGWSERFNKQYGMPCFHTHDNTPTMTPRNTTEGRSITLFDYANHLTDQGPYAFFDNDIKIGASTFPADPLRPGRYRTFGVATRLGKASLEHDDTQILPFEIARIWNLNRWDELTQFIDRSIGIPIPPVS